MPGFLVAHSEKCDQLGLFFFSDGRRGTIQGTHSATQMASCLVLHNRWMPVNLIKDRTDHVRSLIYRQSVQRALGYFFAGWGRDFATEVHSKRD